VHELAKRLDRPIVLVGLMGVGKSTVGRRLARRLGLPFVDSDSAIEDASGYSAAEVFERFGESDYRDGERRLVARLIDGTITVWLDAPVEVLADRTARRNTRPLLRNDDPKATLERLALEERPSYSAAHIHVKSGDGAHRDVVDSIVSALENHLSAKD
jgi:shikimate kinase